MQKQLTIAMDEKMLLALYSLIGSQDISLFFTQLTQSYISNLNHQNLETGYQSMANDREREKDAFDWAEGVIGDLNAQ